MDLQAALAELSASCRLAAQVPDGEKLLRAAARRLAAAAESMGEVDFAAEASRLADEDGAFEALLSQAEALAAGEVAPPAPEAEAEEAVHITSDTSDEDDELVEMLVQSIQEASANTEDLILKLEQDIDDETLVAEIRRVIHTVKGEAGVLGLDAAQELCHEAEEMIDRAVEGGEIPALIDPMLVVVDWLRRYAEALSNAGAYAPAPDAADIRARIAATPGAAPTEAPVVEPTPAPVAAAPQPVAQPDPAPESADLQSTELVQLVPDALIDDTLQDFIDESRHHLEDIEGDLLEFESRPDDAELLNRIFRAFHTIKGVAGFMNLTAIVELTHITETLLDRLRQNTLDFQNVHVDLVLHAADLTSRMVESLTGAEPPQVGQVKRLERRLEQALAGESVESAVEVAQPIQEAIQAAELDTAAGQNAGLADPKRIGELLVERGVIAEGQLEKAIATQAERSASGATLRLGELLVELGQVTQEQVDAALSDQQGAAPAARAMAAPVEVSAPATQAAPAAAETKTVQPEAARRRPQADATIKVSTVRLDSLVDMVGELVIAQQMVLQDPDVRATKSPVLSRNLSQVFKITRDLQEASMSLRMVTFRSTFQKVSRLVRDVAQKANKKVDLIVSGADTEVDRNVVERISDPLVHLVRNAIDHGLEPPDGRAEAGKDPMGRLELSAYHASGAIVVEVKDDGRGLDRQKILGKAIEKNLLPPNLNPEELTDEEVFKLVFEPGFSTAAQVTDISGRGVGMDVVKKNIEAMRGRIEIQSELGTGTTFMLRLPLTLAIIDGMVVRVGGQRFVLPTLAIEESFQPSARKVHRSSDGNEVIDVRGALLPLRHLAQLVQEDPDGGDGVMVLLSSGSDRFCLKVDEILGQQQVVIKNLGTHMPKIPGVAGGAIMGDGRVALIIDVEGLTREALSSASF